VQLGCQAGPSGRSGRSGRLSSRSGRQLGCQAGPWCPINPG